MSRYAILCGLDYDSIDSNNNDNKSNYNIANMYNFLVQKCEYSTQNINIISDCINLSRKSTSRLNILNCITSLVNQCKSGDSIFLYYCGHGSFKSQRDVFDNIIVSNDNKSSGCIENDLLYSTDTQLNKRFIENAPFSKFYLSEDTKSPGRIGQWIGWQIVRSYMVNNDVSLQDLLSMNEEEIFKNSKYKPRK